MRLLQVKSLKVQGVPPKSLLKVFYLSSPFTLTLHRFTQRGVPAVGSGGGFCPTGRCSGQTQLLMFPWKRFTKWPQFCDDFKNYCFLVCYPFCFVERIRQLPSTSHLGMNAVHFGTLCFLWKLSWDCDLIHPFFFPITNGLPNSLWPQSRALVFPR